MMEILSPSLHRKLSNIKKVKRTWKRLLSRSMMLMMMDKHLSTKYWFGKYWISSRQDAIESKVFSFLISQLQISSAKLRVKHFLNLSQIKLWNFPILANKNLLNQNQISDEGETSSCCAKWNIFAIPLWENSIKKKSFGWRLFAFRNLGELKSFGRKIT